MIQKIAVLQSTLVLLGLILTPPLWAASQDQKKGIKWYGYEEGRRQAVRSGKKIFLHFKADWCVYCTKMDKETFVSRPVVRYLNDNFVSIIIDVDRRKKIAAKYRVRPLPMTIFIDHDGAKLAGRPGYIEPERLLKLLQFFHTDSYKDMSFKDFLHKT